MHRIWISVIAVFALLSTQIIALPSLSLEARQAPTPYFPEEPESCGICEASYDTINSCAGAAYLFQNFSQILLNPSGFTDLIKCSCTDTFESVFPQCVDCFIQTNQTEVLQTNSPSSLVSGLRTVCAFASTLFGGVASANGQLPSDTAVSGTPIATGTVATTTATVAVPVTVTESATSSSTSLTSAAGKGYTFPMVFAHLPLGWIISVSGCFLMGVFSLV
ncbi:hypothetical protein FRB94_010370 [Tulasnella sp. JGI-2019a]|nr:hypothetical protein FRB94_010370 [Tulasnella sp. JGI-2019a]KAG9024734.1 hypothetical protein FRB95_011143 [Tulasnella sp. JGI-2019a]